MAFGKPFFLPPLRASVVLGNHVCLWQLLDRVGRAIYISCCLPTSPKRGRGAGLGSPGTAGAILEAELGLGPPAAPQHHDVLCPHSPSFRPKGLRMKSSVPGSSPAPEGITLSETGSGTVSHPVNPPKGFS